MAVLMLKTFTEQRRPSGGSAQHEALAARVGKRPDEIPDALEPEHRVIDKERNHGHAVVRIRCAGSREAGHRSRFGYTFLENLAILRLAIVHDHIPIDRRIELALARVDADLAEERVHTK